jgi:hypothetical protein
MQYGQVEAINQMINAYFQVTFAEWCWVFMDGKSSHSTKFISLANFQHDLIIIWNALINLRHMDNLIGICIAPS